MGQIGKDPEGYDKSEKQLPRKGRENASTRARRYFEAGRDFLVSKIQGRLD